MPMSSLVPTQQGWAQKRGKLLPGYSSPPCFPGSWLGLSFASFAFSFFLSQSFLVWIFTKPQEKCATCEILSWGWAWSWVRTFQWHSLQTVLKNSRNSSMPGKKILDPVWLRPKLQMSPNFQTRAISWWVTMLARTVTHPAGGQAAWVVSYKNISSALCCLGTVRWSFAGPGCPHVCHAGPSSTFGFHFLFGVSKLILRLGVRWAAQKSPEILLVCFSKYWGDRSTTIFGFYMDTYRGSKLGS